MKMRRNISPALSLNKVDKKYSAMSSWILTLVAYSIIYSAKRTPRFSRVIGDVLSV